MKKKISAIVLGVYLTGIFGTAYAYTDSTLNKERVKSAVVSQKNAIVGKSVFEAQDGIIIDKDEIKYSAGVLPNSVFYSLERGIEQLQLAIAKSEEKLASLRAQFAAERAAEAVIMTNEGKEELASKATGEYMNLVALAAEHINNAIVDKNESIQTLEVLNESYRISERIFTTILEEVPENYREALEDTLNKQDKAIVAINDFYAAKEAFFASRNQFQEAKRELEAAKESGDSEAIRIAGEKVKVTEELKDELEGLKNVADLAKEEVKNLSNQAEKRIEHGMKQVERIKEKASENAKKVADMANKVEEKSSEAIKKAKQKAAGQDKE